MKHLQYMSQMNEHNSWRVLLVGNNPIELGRLCTHLHEIPYKRILAEMAFDLNSMLSRLNHFDPQHILIDDNLSRIQLRHVVESLHREAGAVPITVLKNSNYEETVCSGVTNFVLKSQLTGDKLYREMLNANHFLHMQQHWVRAYGTRRKPLRDWLQAAMI